MTTKRSHVQNAESLFSKHFAPNLKLRTMTRPRSGRWKLLQSGTENCHYECLRSQWTDLLSTLFFFSFPSIFGCKYLAVSEMKTAPSTKTIRIFQEWCLLSPICFGNLHSESLIWNRHGLINDRGNFQFKKKTGAVWVSSTHPSSSSGFLSLMAATSACLRGRVASVESACFSLPL